ncbi:MAG: hypothetical protein GX802_07385, partial [Clostridiales bacterium]|nr:hypothetical protein [Clostridiales bacterium]
MKKLFAITLIFALLLTVPNIALGTDETEYCEVTFALTGHHFFESEGDIKTRTITVEKGYTLTVSDVPTDMDHCIDMDGGCFGTITGWTPFEAVGYVVNEDITFTAIMTPLRSVFFHDLKGNNIYEYTLYVPDGSSLLLEELPPLPKENGYIPIGWDITAEELECITASVTINSLYREIGDVNGDNSVNTGDAVLVLLSSIGSVK